MPFPTLDGTLQIFDVDHGQCALLTMPSQGGAYRALIDCGHSVDFGGRPWYPGGHLQSLGVKYLDLMVCTNFDEDHMSGFPDLYNRGISVGCILGNPTVSPDTVARLKTEDGMGYGIERLTDVLRARAQLGWIQHPNLTPPDLNMWWTWNPYPSREILNLAGGETCSEPARHFASERVASMFSSRHITAGRAESAKSCSKSTAAVLSSWS
jgi:hypothetical protein